MRKQTFVQIIGGQIIHVVRIGFTVRQVAIASVMYQDIGDTFGKCKLLAGVVAQDLGVELGA
jgi:hypothetical protein